MSEKEIELKVDEVLDNYILIDEELKSLEAIISKLDSEMLETERRLLCQMTI